MRFNPPATQMQMASIRPLANFGKARVCAPVKRYDDVQMSNLPIDIRPLARPLNIGALKALASKMNGIARA